MTSEPTFHAHSDMFYTRLSEYSQFHHGATDHDKILPPLLGTNIRQPTQEGDKIPLLHTRKCDIYIPKIPAPIDQFTWSEAIENLSPFTVDELLTAQFVRTPAYSVDDTGETQYIKYDVLKHIYDTKLLKNNLV